MAKAWLNGSAKWPMSLRAVCFVFLFLLRPVFLRFFFLSFFFFFFEEPPIRLLYRKSSNSRYYALSCQFAVVSIVRLLLHNSTRVSAIPSGVCNFLRLYFPPVAFACLTRHSINERTNEPINLAALQSGLPSSVTPYP